MRRGLEIVDGDWNSSKKMTPVKNETNGGEGEKEEKNGGRKHISYLVHCAGAGAGANFFAYFLSGAGWC